MALQPLRKPHIVKIRDLPDQRNGYTVFVRVLAIDKQYEMFKHGSLVPAIQVKVGDETGTALGLFCGKDIDIIKEGNVVCIRNGLKKYLNNKFLLALDDFGRVTLEQMNIEAINNHDVSIEVAGKHYKRADPKRDNGRTKKIPKANKSNYDRNYQNGDRLKDEDYQRGNGDRKNRNNSKGNYQQQERFSVKRDNKSKPMKGHGQPLKERREQSTYWKDTKSYPKDEVANQSKKKYVQKKQVEESNRPHYIQKSNKQSDRVWTKLNKVSPGEDNLNITVKILSIKVVNDHRRMLKCQVADDTGVSDAKLEDQGFVQVGATVNLLNAEAQVVYEHIELRSEKMEASNHRIGLIERGFNLSAKAWVPKAD